MKKLKRLYLKNNRGTLTGEESDIERRLIILNNIKRVQKKLKERNYKK